MHRYMYSTRKHCGICADTVLYLTKCVEILTQSYMSQQIIKHNTGEVAGFQGICQGIQGIGLKQFSLQLSIFNESLVLNI